MPNIASIMKEEIVRLARKEIRAETERLKQSSAKFRTHIADLKRQVAGLEKQLATLQKKSNRSLEPVAADEAGTQVRFSAKGLARKRERLGLSAAYFGTLLGVSAQTIYNWESGKGKPRQAQLVIIAAVRKMGKRQIKSQLESLTS